MLTIETIFLILNQYQYLGNYRLMEMFSLLVAVLDVFNQYDLYHVRYTLLHFFSLPI